MTIYTSVKVYIFADSGRRNQLPKGKRDIGVR